MLRYALFAWLAVAGCLCAGEEPRVEMALPVPPRSVIYTLERDQGADVDFGSYSAERQMVERLVLALTGEKDLKKAWSALVQPTDVVGLKVASRGGPLFSTHPGVILAVVEGLELAGVPRKKMVIWDRLTSTLRDSGIMERAPRGVRVVGIDPPRGFDADAKISSPGLGQLIWGDLGFRGAETGLRRRVLQESQVSGESHLPKILSREVTRVINLPTYSDEAGCGVAGALYNMTVPILDNSRRFTQKSGPSSICDLYGDERLGGKVALTIVDGLRAQYAGGPEFNPNYSVVHRMLLTSKDPVALDATMMRQLEKWRLEAKFPSMEKTAAWLEEAQTIGLGNFAEERIVVRALPPL